MPRDYRALNQFFKLKEMIGEVNAIVLIDCLWSQLGYQLEMHRVSGFFQSTEVTPFVASLPIKINNVMDKLVDSDWLVRRGDDFECPMFFYYNPELDGNYIPKLLPSQYANFEKEVGFLYKESPGVVAKLAQELWLGPDRHRILPAKMNDAVVLIKVMDNVLKLGKRRDEEYDLPLIHAALRVMDNYSEDKRNVILRRLFIKRTTQGVPRNTVACLDKFDEVVCLIMPDEGFANWSRKDKSV